MAALTSVVVVALTHQIVRAQLVAEAEQVAYTLAESSRLPLLYQSKQLNEELANTALSFPNVIGIKLQDNKGEVVYEQGDNFETRLDSMSSTESRLIQENNDRWVFAVPVISSGSAEALWEEVADYGQDATENQLLGYIAISVSKHTLEEMQNQVIVSILYVSATLSVVILLILITLSRRLTNPLVKLAEVMEQGVAENHQVRTEIHGPVDLEKMQRAFNKLMGELEDREKELLVAMNSALDSARIKGEFAANVTHELRTPMNAVLGMLELLQTMGLTPKQQEYVEIAKTSGENLLCLIDDVLDFSEIDARKTEILFGDCCLFELLDEVVGLLAGQALKRGLDLGYALDNELPDVISTDLSKLRQVLINLVGNAVKFTRIGEVAIEVTLAEDSHAINFAINDTGIGISEESQKVIFEAFTQAETSVDKEFEGTGLGLAISKQLVQLMGGDLQVSSELGKGSCFFFSLPLQDQENMESLPVKYDFAGKRVVFVDNSRIARSFAEKRFDRMGVSGTIFENGLTCLNYLRNTIGSDEQPDVVFIDQDMPGIKGHDLIRLVKEDFEKQLTDIALVLMVNPWSSDDLPQVTGIVKLTKPLKYDSLYNAIYDANSLKKERKVARDRPSDATFNHSILVVDDNKPNQQVARGMLENLGCSVHIAENGQLAIEKLIRNRFDLVLMDCYMPVMNGYDATRQIRMFENGDEEIPVIAMTANNNKEEQDKCLNAGMNDFLAKPLRLIGLQNILEKWLVERDSQSASPDPVADDDLQIQDMVHIDKLAMQQLRDSVGEMTNSIIEAFLEDTPVYLQSLKSALSAGNELQVRDLAHTIKGSAGNFGAQQVMVLSKSLEDAGKKKNLTGMEEVFSKLETAFHAARNILEKELISSGSLTRRENFQILIVDDDRSIRLALRNIFRIDGYEIEEATTGTHAINLCERRMPDLILLDAVMPGIDGFSTCEEMRKLPHGADIPILIVTGLDNEEAITRAFEAGATDYITKPIHFSVLKQRVTRLIKASKTEKHVRKLAYHDSLTGLPNRSSLMQHLRVVVNRASLENSRAAVLFLDLDRFKDINDTMGHDTGDLLLKAVADRIRRCVREQDFIARLGGDEFTVVLENISDEQSVSAIAEKICHSLSQPFGFLQQTMFVTTSIGISIFPDDGKDVTTLLKHADTAMFGAKEQGNGCCFYREGMEDEIAQRLEMERDLREAIARDELCLHYQPQIDTKTGEVVSAEALVRWHHKELGLLPPMRFIPLAELSGLINEVGAWVLEAAIKQLRAWQEKGFTAKIGVNLSGRELKDTSLHKRILELSETYAINPEFLELEITESMFMENPEENEQELNALRAMGVNLAIDDFGTGFSSLNYLKRLPVDVIKIDRSFIQDIEHNNSDLSIVSGIIGLAESLGMETVAEGVETEGQLTLLQQRKCGRLQGFLFSKPLPPDEFEEKFLKIRNPEEIV